MLALVSVVALQRNRGRKINSDLLTHREGGRAVSIEGA